MTVRLHSDQQYDVTKWYKLLFWRDPNVWHEKSNMETSRTILLLIYDNGIRSCLISLPEKPLLCACLFSLVFILAHQRTKLYKKTGGRSIISVWRPFFVCLIVCLRPLCCFNTVIWLKKGDFMCFFSLFLLAIRFEAGLVRKRSCPIFACHTTGFRTSKVECDHSHSQWATVLLPMKSG